MTTLEKAQLIIKQDGGCRGITCLGYGDISQRCPLRLDNDLYCAADNEAAIGSLESTSVIAKRMAQEFIDARTLVVEPGVVTDHDVSYFEKKHDHGKLRFDLILPEFEEGIAKVLTFGAAEYGDNTWQTVEDAEARYYGALRRHISEWYKGERFASDSKIHHLHHAATNLMFLIWLEEQRLGGKDE